MNKEIEPPEQVPTRIASVKASVGRIALAAAVVLFILGFFMLCDCPGMYALAAALAGVAAWAGKGRLRFWAMVTSILSLGATAVMTIEKIKLSLSR